MTSLPQSGNATALHDQANALHPDLLIVDVRMLPTMTSDGAVAVERLREVQRHLPTISLSQHGRRGGLYSSLPPDPSATCSRDRVLAVYDFLDVLARVAKGGTALDPAIVQALGAPTRHGRSRRGNETYWNSSLKENQTPRFPVSLSTPNAP
jgi:DNA-binding NarL/FixJ family response regulator